MEKMMEPSFEKLLGHLAAHKIEFLLVGGLAVALHGYVRLTEDVAILIDTDPANISRFIEAMAKYGEGHGGTFLAEDFDETPGALRLIEETEQSQLDIFTVMGGLTYQDFVADAERYELGDHTIRYASRAMLIRFKSSSVREKDQIDVFALKRLEHGQT